MMEKFLDTNRLHHLLGWTLLGLLLALLALEGWRYGVKPSEDNNEQVVEKSLDMAADYFLQKQKELLVDSEELAATLRPSLLQKQSPGFLYRILERFPDFWSAALFHSDQPLIWKGFALNHRPQEETHPGEPVVSLKKSNNIIYWECYFPFSIQDSSGTISYELYTSHRIEQNNPLPIGDRSEYHIFDSPDFSTPYPLNFSIFNERPASVVQARPLQNLQGDSVGVVYATAEEFRETKSQWEQNTRFWRSLYVLICFIALALISFRAADRLSSWRSLALQLLFIGIGWGIFASSDLLSYWVLTLSELSESWATTVKSLSSTFTNALFGLLAAVSIARKLRQFRHKISPDWYLTSIGLAGISGVANALLISSLFDYLFRASVGADVPLLDLRIVPSWGTIILYLSVGLSLLALGIFLIAINRWLFSATKEHFKLSASVVFTVFLISLLVIQLYVPDQLVFNWVFYSSILSFAFIFSAAVAYAQQLGFVTFMSPLRKVVLGTFMISAASLPLIYQSSLNKLDINLWETAKNYSQEKDPFAAEITKQLLSTLEANFREISEEDLQAKRSALQARFSQTIQSFLSPRWNTYSFDLQLINTSGDVIADYSTDLNSPHWLSIFNIQTLRSVTEIEQITKSTIQPIVQQPQLINQEAYRTFYRGWIPVFGSSENSPIAWILSSVYRERPEFNKPIRAVMASLTYEDWNTAYLMQKYQNGKQINSAQVGFAGYFPKYRTLSEAKLKALKHDPVIYLTERTSDNAYRTLYWNESDDSTIKISTSLPDSRVILFSFFRFSFTLLLFGCLTVLLAQILSWGNISFLGKNKRFQDRILDSFLLATLVFVAFLIVTSHYAIKQQNQDIVRQELMDKLKNLSETVGSSYGITENVDASSISLSSLTTPLNVDATFYDARMVTETTTPQIYQQHLLPAVLPFEIFHQLFIQRQQDAYSTVNLAGQKLLIGYQSIINNQNETVGTLAIPTFLESPKYDQQLLETTSYLILIYLLVFGLFILGSTVISKQLTRPLVYIQRGLNKISSGNLDTTIPVTSKDEIGNIAKAYNTMVSRLKKLQKELAAAEREAAWKEMAQQVAHEIKNPLTPMKLNVQHLERQLRSDNQDPAELKKRVQKITGNLIEQIQTLNSIASDFSKFSQPLEEEFSKVDLGSVLSSVTNLYQHDERVKVEFHSENGSIYVMGIPDELKRVIINLVKNAYEAMPEEGGEIILRLYRKQQHAFVEVEDNGAGIAEEDRPNIFVPNFSTKSSGTGLGLAICKKIIEAHEGSISFASVEDEGTTFVIKLPQG